MKAGHHDIVAVHCRDAVRKENEQKQLLRLSSQISSVASRVQTAVTMRQVTGNMANVVRGMNGAMKTMNINLMTSIMEQFSVQNEDMDAVAQHYETTASTTTASTIPQDEVNDMMKQLADQAGIELSDTLVSVPEQTSKGETLDSRLQRLRA